MRAADAILVTERRLDPMPGLILSRTPLWVWPLLAALLVLGWTQARPRRVALPRLLILPVVMTLLSLAGLLSAFGSGPTLLAAWAVAGAAVAWLVGRLPPPAGASLDRASRRLEVPGSWTPMLLIVAIFLTKYGVGVALGMRPGLASSAPFGHAIGALYGLFSGVFVGRAARLVRLARRPELARPPRPPRPPRSTRAVARGVLASCAALLLLAAALVGVLVAFGTRDAPPALASLNDAVMQADYAALPPLQTFVARDGRRLAYRAYLAPAGAPVALLVHGSSGDSHGMHGVGRALAAAGIAAYAVDVRGHGASGPRGDVVYVGQLDDDLADLAALLRQRHPGSRLALVGHSSGGGFVLRNAGTQPTLFDAWLMLAPMLHQEAPTTRPGVGGWAVPFVPRIVGLRVLDAIGLRWFQQLPVIAFAVPPGDAGRTATYSYRLQASFRPHDDFRADLRGIAGPAALLVGGADELFVADAYAPLVQSVRPDIDVRVLPGVTHIGIVQDRVALAAVVAALRRLLGAAPAESGHG